MKIKILEIGRLRLSNKIFKKGFSLLEILVVIFLISILSYFISISYDYLSKNNKKYNINEKIKLIENEIKYFKQISLSYNNIIILKSNNKFLNSKVQSLNIQSFKNCISFNNKVTNLLISPSGEVNSYYLNCKIDNKNIILKLNNSGKVIKYEKE